jgi:hypothetical protein
MKTIVRCFVLLCLFYSIQGFAQQPGDRKGLADKTTLKGKHELRKEMRIKKRSERNAKNQESKAAMKSPIKNYRVGKQKKVKVQKSKNKEMKTEEPREKDNK